MAYQPWGNPPKKVKCLDIKTGKVIAEYDSLLQAAIAIGKASARPNIAMCCKGYQQTAYGYRWEFAE